MGDDGSDFTAGTVLRIVGMGDILKAKFVALRYSIGYGPR